MKLSDYVVKFFEDLNVSNVFMVSGGGCMHLVDSFGRSSKIKYVATQHEQAAAMAAEAFSKYKNDLGLVLATSGPGATNTVTGILDCWQDSIPVVYIFGQAKSRQTCAGVDDGANASIPSGAITESKSGRTGKSGNSSLAKENGHCTNKKPVIIKNIKIFFIKSFFIF